MKRNPAGGAWKLLVGFAAALASSLVIVCVFILLAVLGAVQDRNKRRQ